MKKKSKLNTITQTIKSTLSIFFAMVILLSAIVFWIFQQTSIDVLVREIDHKKEKHQDLKLTNDRLKRIIDRLESYSRIESIAKKDLNLVDAKKAPYIFSVVQDSFVVELKMIQTKREDKGFQNQITKAGF
jgi:cell division protein FtsL